MGFVLWFADPLRHDMHSLPGIIAGCAGLLLTAYAGVRARVYADRATAVALGLGALPLVLIAGSGIIGPDAYQGPGRLQFLLGCVAVLIASVVLVALTPSGDAPFVATTFLAAVGTLATFVAILTESSATGTAAVCAPVALGLVAFLPGLSARFARLPIGYASPRTAPAGYDDTFADPNTVPEGAPVDADRIAAQARRGHEMLLGLVGGCAAVVVGSAAVLGFSDNIWGQFLALATGLAMLLRARLFRYTSQVACVLVAGIGAIALLVLGLCLNPLGRPAVRAGPLRRPRLPGHPYDLALRRCGRRRHLAHRDRPDHSAQGTLPVLGPPPRPHGGRPSPLPGPALPGRTGHLRQSQGPDQLVP